MAVAIGVDITVGDGVSASAIVGEAVGVSDLIVGVAVGTNRATV